MAGIQAALDLADWGIPVHLVESSPFLGGAATVPRHLLNARLLEVVKHPLITVWTNTRVNRIGGEAGRFHVELLQRPRYVDLTRCTACGDCIAVCPITVPGTNHKAIYLDGQPGCVAIDKLGIAPCREACPTSQRAQGYIALIRQKRYADAYWAIRREHPFPSVCGRVCNHRCEEACTRGRYDEPVNIMGLKRFVADWAYAHRDELANMRDKSLVGTPFQHQPKPTGKKVAIIGAGPAGLTAALDLVRLGHAVTVFDVLPVAGGMMRVGIPPHRLPAELLDWEIQQIVDEGVELKLNTWVDDIPGLLGKGYHAVLIATGTHVAKKLPIKNSDHPDNWLSLDVLRRVRLGEKIELGGKRVVVLGGGNVALDTARTVLRLGASQVRMACLEPRGEMPGFAWEIAVAEEEGIEMCAGRTFKEILVEEGKIVGVRCVEVVFRGFKNGRPDIDEIPGTEHVLPADLVVWAIGQRPDFSFLPQDGSIQINYPVGIQSDANMMTTMPGVFVAGDMRRGVTFFVVDAIHEGHRAARSIDRYLRGAEGVREPVLPPRVELSEEEIHARLVQGGISQRGRIQISSIPLEERVHNFREVDLTLTEEEALAEAERCLRCALCSECLECLAACQRGAIDHEMQDSHQDLIVGAIIYADDPTRFVQRGSSLTLPLEDGPGLYRVPPDSPLMGSAAAAWAMSHLFPERHRWRVVPGPAVPESLSEKLGQTSSEVPARIGVFVCQCGDQIASVVDTEVLRDQAAHWPDVVHAQVLPFACSPEAAERVYDAVAAHGLNRVVLAACSCCSIDQVCYSCTYQRVRCKSNLGIFKRQEAGGKRQESLATFEFVNIREQCAWVHADDPRAATAKAVTLVAAGVARARTMAARPIEARSIEHSALILGHGPAARACRVALAGQGVAVWQVEGLPERVQRAGGRYAVTQGGTIWQASALVLVPQDADEAHRLLAAFGEDGHQPRPQPAWGGLDTHRPGVFYCDPVLDPAMAGAAAAARVAAWLGRMEMPVKPVAAVVDPARCRACGTCVQICEFGAPRLVGEEPRRASWIDPAICTGCGTCVAHCPSGAITDGHLTDAQLEAMLDAVLGEAGTTTEPRAIAFTCNWHPYSGLEAAGAEHLGYPSAIRPVRVACLGRLSAGIILKAFAKGADGVLLLGCPPGECHHGFGNRRAQEVFAEAKGVATLLGYRDEQLKLEWLAAGEGKAFVDKMWGFVSGLK